ncbi:hypothetical protein GM708_06630 [Vibrio cholerae]|nr:hypothetical protein [Vibrio cholerae]
MTSKVPQLTTITVFEGDGSVLVRYDLDSSVPPTNTFLVGFYAVSADGKVRKQFGIKFLDAQAIALFVFDNDARPQQENFDYVAATNDPNVIMTPYPTKFWDALGEEPQLRGFLNHDGEDRQTDVVVKVVNRNAEDGR